MRTHVAPHWLLVNVLALLVCGSCGDSPTSPTPAPATLTVKDVVPNMGPEDVSFPVQIRGTGFVPGVTAAFDGVALDVAFVSGTLLTATAPPHREGSVDLVVINPSGRSVRLAGALTYVPFTVTDIIPNRALPGAWVRISGRGLLPGASVTFDGLSARVIAEGPSLLHALAPLHAAGTVDVTVTNPTGRQATLVQGFTYQAVEITASPTVVAPGGDLIVSWQAPPGRSVSDWIGLYKVSDPNTVYITYEYTMGLPSGTLKFRAPAQAGEYEFRYLVDDEYNEAARSGPIRVLAASR